VHKTGYKMKTIGIKKEVFDLLKQTKPSVTSWSDHLQYLREHELELHKEIGELRRKLKQYEVTK